MARKPGAKTTKTVETLKHDEARRKNIPTAEHQSVLQKEQEAPRKVKYPRNTDLDPQLVWRGKDEQDWSDLVVHAPPLYIQEKVHPKALIDDLLRQTKESEHETGQITADLFADFNGIPKGVDKTEAPTALRVGSSIPITTRKASSFAMRISSAPTIPTAPSRQR